MKIITQLDYVGEKSIFLNWVIYVRQMSTTLITIQLDCVRNHLLLSKSNTFVKCIKHRSKSHILQHQIDPDLNLHPYQQLLPLGPEYQTS